MKNVMLIDVEGVKKLSYLHDNVLPKTISVTIMRVQNIMLKRLMGVKEYAALLDKVSASLPPTTPIVPLDAATQELIQEYIHPYIAACVDYRIVYPLTFKSGSKSNGKSTDENHVPSTLEEMTKLKNQLLIDVDSFAEDLKEKLFEYSLCDTDESHLHHKHRRGEQRSPGRSIKFR